MVCAVLPVPVTKGIAAQQRKTASTKKLSENTHAKFNHFNIYNHADFNHYFNRGDDHQ
jgi:hypothetical protein